MSLKSKRNNRYSRAEAKKDSRLERCLLNNAWHQPDEYCWLCDDMEYDYAMEEPGPSLENIRYGWLLSILTKFKLKSAKQLFDQWYW